MSTNNSHVFLIRSILTKTLATVSNLTETLDGLLIDEKTTLSKLEELRYQVKEMEKTHANLNNLIDTTRLSKEKMEMVAHDLRCQLSPMKTLPTEILVKMFLETIELANKERRAVASTWVTPNPDQTCLLLTQVCTRWRSIFFLHPSLWRYCEFNSREQGELDYRERAANRLKHSVKQGFFNQQSLFVADWRLKLHEYLLPTLTSFSGSPNALELDLMDDSEGSWDIQAIKAQCVTVYRSDMTPTCRYISPMLRSAHEVTLYGNPPEWGNLPWVTLRTFVLKEFSDSHKYRGYGISFDRENLSQLLNAAPFLENLQLGFKVDETTLAWATNLSVTHTHLKSLTVHLHHFIGGKGLFGIQLELPALRTIEFLSIHCRLASLDEEFICKLNTPTKLILPELESHEVQFAAELLRWLPSVKYVDMVGKNVNTLLDIARAIYQRSPPLVTPLLSPALTTLHIENTDIFGEMLVEFVRAKLQHKLAGTEGVSAIEHIEMYETPGVSVADWEKIQALLEEGIVANSTHSSSD